MKTLFSRLAAGALLCAVAGPFFAVAAAPIEITDALGRKVIVESPAKRIVVNFNFEEFTAVAGKDGWANVVGISRAPWEGWRPAIFSRYSAVIPNLAAMPDIGHTDDGSFSAEKVIALKPDVLLLSEWAYASLETQRKQIEAAGVPILVIDYNAQSLDRHLASTRALGRATGNEARAEELAQLYERELRDILARIATSKAGKKRVYVELGQGGPDVIGNSYSGTMWGKIFGVLGAENLADGKLAGPWGPLHAEQVLASDPDLIFIAGSSWVNRPAAVKTGYAATPEITRASLAPYAKRPGWADLKAVKTGGLHAIEHGLARSLFDFVAMQYIAKQLYPDVFQDVDPEVSFKAYHAKYLPVAYSGVWMLSVKP